jgi:hypothetical protein
MTMTRKGQFWTLPVVGFLHTEATAAVDFGGSCDSQFV